MKTSELIQAIETLSNRIESISWQKAFTDMQTALSYHQELKNILLELKEKWIEWESWKYEENWVEFCSCCGQKVSLKRRRIERSMITALLKAIHYCRKSWKKTFHKKDVSTLSPVEYTLIAFLPKFGLLYKSENMVPWEFWIPFKICAEFFSWVRDVLEYYDIDPTKKEWEKWFKVNSESRLFFKDIPKHSDIVKDFPSTIEFWANNTFE